MKCASELLCSNFYIYDIYDTCGNDQVSRADIFEALREMTVMLNSTADSF